MKYADRLGVANHTIFAQEIHYETQNRLPCKGLINFIVVIVTTIGEFIAGVSGIVNFFLSKELAIIPNLWWLFFLVCGLFCIVAISVKALDAIIDYIYRATAITKEYFTPIEMRFYDDCIVAYAKDENGNEEYQQIGYDHIRECTYDMESQTVCLTGHTIQSSFESTDPKHLKPKFEITSKVQFQADGSPDIDFAKEIESVTGLQVEIEQEDSQ